MGGGGTYEQNFTECWKNLVIFKSNECLSLKQFDSSVLLESC